jgi:hypothetical protein
VTANLNEMKMHYISMKRNILLMSINVAQFNSSQLSCGAWFLKIKTCILVVGIFLDLVCWLAEEVHIIH